MISLKARTLLALAVVAMIVPIASAEIVYDNSTTATKGVHDPLVPVPNNLEDGYWAIDQIEGYNGDQVHLDGTNRFVTKFTVYLAASQAITDTDVTLELWDVDSDTYYPGNLLWTGSKAGVDVGSDPTPVFFEPQVLVPDDLVWMVRTSGTRAHEFGLATFDPPTVGSSTEYGADFYWNNDPAMGFGLYTFNFGAAYLQQQKANFGATIEAIPEPCTIALLAAGGMLLIRGRRSR